MSRSKDDMPPVKEELLHQTEKSKPKRLTQTVRIYADTVTWINKAIVDGAIKDINGTEADKISTIVEVAVAKLLNLRIPNDVELDLMSRYEFTIEQLDVYQKLEMELKKELRTPINRRLLQEAVRVGEGQLFVDKINEVKPQELTLENF